MRSLTTFRGIPPPAISTILYDYLQLGCTVISMTADHLRSSKLPRARSADMFITITIHFTLAPGVASGVTSFPNFSSFRWQKTKTKLRRPRTNRLTEVVSDRIALINARERDCSSFLFHNLVSIGVFESVGLRASLPPSRSSPRSHRLLITFAPRPFRVGNHVASPFPPEYFVISLTKDSSGRSRRANRGSVTVQS